MGCNQSSHQFQDAAAASSPTASASPDSKSRPKLVKYRTLLTGQTVFDGGSPSKAASRLNSRCTSKASLKSDVGSVGAASFKLGDQVGQGIASQGLETDGSPITDCSPSGRDGHFDPQMAEQAGTVTVEEMLLTTKIASIAYAGGSSTDAKYQEFVDASVQAAVGLKSQQPLKELLRPLGLSLDRSFAYREGVSVQGFIAYGESDLILSYSAGLAETQEDCQSLVGTAEFAPLAENPGYMSIFDCCSGMNSCSNRAPSAHEAYVSACMASVPDIEAALLPRLRSKQKPVRLVIAGHGIGGAIATGALAYILKKVDIENTPHKLLFVSTGQPKFGDCIFRVWLEEQITRLAVVNKCKFARVAHDCDPVPAGPQGMPTLVHIGSPHLLTQEGGMLLGEEALGSLEVKAAQMGAELREMHQPAKYIELLSLQKQQPMDAK
mmetsp:Transcript_8395/g.22789  ORF Transcript_8395/g.22789 Transcript_8395/m.22789 type:complete len:437 (-) Transcript_8395:138-1448(-)